MKRHIPNLLSLTNATAGALGVYFAVEGCMQAVLACIVVALVADFLDGFMARLLKSFSPLGKDLDSLSDAISFGVLPAVLSFRMLQGLLLPEWCTYVAFLIVPSSVYRLAKFNHDERQSTSFIGLPTPANALFWLGAYYVGGAWSSRGTAVADSCLHYMMPVLVLLCSWLLVSEVPMFSLKGKQRTTIESIQLYAVLLITVVAVVCMGLSGLMLGIGVYILTNLVLWLVASSTQKNKKLSKQ